MSKTGAELIADERNRQIEKEGYTQEHDDQHSDGSLAMAAATYALVDVDDYAFEPTETVWPPNWSLESWKPKDRISNLVRAGALIAAEIDRLQRTKPATNNEQG